RSRNPEAQRGISKLTWCPGPESNRYVPFGTRDFKSRKYHPANSIPKSHVVDSVHTSVRPLLMDECIGEHGKAQRKHKESTSEKHARTMISFQRSQEPTGRCDMVPALLKKEYSHLCREQNVRSLSKSFKHQGRIAFSSRI